MQEGDEQGELSKPEGSRFRTRRASAYVKLKRHDRTRNLCFMYKCTTQKCA